MMHIANVPLAVIRASSIPAVDLRNDSLVDDIVIEITMIASDLCIIALDSVSASRGRKPSIPAIAPINPTNSKTLAEILGGSRGCDFAGRPGANVPSH
ncbi:hypothetical protein [Bradyrhizobium sp. LTSP885]|uniref:hypothetical protein n=1 Tax=Bradyrhizobium sp. LTSP885 TaxID=1619232 RepID=UPI000A45190D|nr:hypothetical protein [Bradyrhizobium sp. LTSP885]